jgi:hypothetical protein
MKVALCFIISYDHVLNKEHIWKEWIGYNKNLFNIYFFYSDIKKIKSPWILEHCLPEEFIFQTSYYHIIPAYLSLMNYALKHDQNNKWFCFLTDSCCPIVSPKRFRYIFEKNYKISIMKWKKAWWNVYFQKRANLEHLPEALHLGNDPWFILSKSDVEKCLLFVQKKTKLAKLISNGGLANESLFAIIFEIMDSLKYVENEVTHITDWSRMSSPTSPHLFHEANERDIFFIENELQKRNYKFFIRKISKDFPDEILRYYIYEKFKKDDEKINFKNNWVFNLAFGLFVLLLYYMLFSGLFQYITI